MGPSVWKLISGRNETTVRDQVETQNIESKLAKKNIEFPNIGNERVEIKIKTKIK